MDAAGRIGRTWLPTTHPSRPLPAGKALRPAYRNTISAPQSRNLYKGRVSIKARRMTEMPPHHNQDNAQRDHQLAISYWQNPKRCRPQIENFQRQYTGAGTTPARFFAQTWAKASPGDHSCDTVHGPLKSCKPVPASWHVRTRRPSRPCRKSVCGPAHSLEYWRHIARHACSPPPPAESETFRGHHNTGGHPNSFSTAR